MEQSFDYVVVGAGAAGCVIASRLSEDPDVSVALIEAGGSDRHPKLTMPLALPFVYGDRRIKWNHVSGPEPHLYGRCIDEQGGRILGGSSSINAMIFNRGNRADYDGWAENAGLSTWSYQHVLPYFRRLETFADGADEYRGGAGPMRIARAQAAHPLFEAFLTAGEQAGFARPADHNGASQEGMHIAQVNIHRGERYSAARAYLWPARSRPNLTVLSRRQVDRILFTGTRAEGVEIGGRHRERIIARREVVLCAGAMNTPKLLMVSGVGPGAELSRHGIPVRADVADIGANVQNHPGVDIQFATEKRHSFASEVTWLRRPGLAARWLFDRSGPGAGNMFEAGAFLRTREGLSAPNMQYEFLPICRKVQSGRIVPVPGFQVWMDLSRPLSRGRMTLSAADPRAPIRTVFNTYSERQDLLDVMAGVRLLRERIIVEPALAQFAPVEINPGPAIQSDAELEEWVRRSTGTSYHASSSCRMGADAEAVVDSEGRVRAVSGLRIADASVIPSTVTGNLQAAVLMIAEKISDAIRGSAPAHADQEGAPCHQS